MNKIFVVSILAIMAVPAAHAVVVSETMLSKTAGTYDKDYTVEMAIADAKAAGTGAVQSVATGSENGTIAVNGTDVAVKGLGGAAYTESSAYDAAGAASGVKSTIDNYTINTKKISTNPTLGGADIQVTNYSNSGLTGNVAATDTINQAIGKLENKIATKQDSGNYVPETRKVNDKALSGDISLTAADVGAVASSGQTASEALITNSSGAVTTGTITDGMITNGTITNAKLANVANAPTDSEENAGNLVTVGVAYDIANIAAGAVVNTAASSYQPKSSSTVSSGTYTYIAAGNDVKGNLAALDAGLGNVRLASGAVQIPSGSETATNYASIWVE